MKHFITFLIFVVVTSAQFTPADFDLAKTTFLHEFDKNIIHQYLTSDDEQKIKAALLSIAQSNDTTFIDEVTKLDFHKYPQLISFALGQLGPNKVSAAYLKKLLFTDSEQNSKYLYEAIGKVGSENDLLDCVDFQIKTDLSGFAYAVYNFHLRGVKNESLSDIEILLNNLKEKEDEEKLFESLFSLYRIAEDKVDPAILENILNGEYNSSIKLYALGILRKQQTFPFSFSLIKEIISDPDWSVRCEAARTVSYYPYETKDELEEFLKLLSDINPSVSRAAAQSIAEINFAAANLKEELIDDLRFYIVNDEVTANVRGEILLTLQKWQPGRTRDLYIEFQCMTTPNYTYQLLGNSEDHKTAFQILKSLYANAYSYDKFLIFSNIGNHYDSLKTDKEFTEFIIEQYKADLPFVITLANYMIDSTFISIHRDKLKMQITSFVDEKLSDENYNQPISTLFILTDKIDSTFSDKLVTKILQSNNFKLQFQLRNRISLSEKVIEERTQLFTDLYSNAFEYSKALIKTSVGDYTIEFSPEVAPISVGNFIALVKKNFFNNIIYHRVVPNFVIQTGDPTGTGWGGPNHIIVSEFSPIPFDTYAVGMASSGKDTEGSQWFVMNNHYPHLNGNYTNFGKVIDGFEVIDRTDQFDMIYEVELLK